MKIIAIANQKGGCGKTTTAINLSSSLSLNGQRVLLIDCDPQAHATLGLNLNSDLEKSMYHVMTPKQEDQIEIEDIVVPVKDNFDLAPSSIILGGVEQELAGVEGREHMLRLAIANIRKPYDYIILDCPPSLGHLCFNALRACGEVIIPIDMSLFSLRGVAKLMEIIILFKTEVGHNIHSRALITMYDFRTRYARRVLARVKEAFGDNVLNTVIRYNIRLRETVDYGLPVGDYDKHAIGHKDYEKLAEEIISIEADFMHQECSSRHGAQDILQKAEKYINAAQESQGAEMPQPEVEELSAPELESSYSKMVETIAAKHPDPVSENAGKLEKL
jgi:chromosome partitioning protein